MAVSDVMLDEGGGAAIPVAVIDGPYDAAALSGVLARTPINLGSGNCGMVPSDACHHGTFVMGLLGARKEASIPGLCPDCELLHIPLFVDEDAPQASVEELAKAIMLSVAAGARLINLSLAILGHDAQNDPELAAALDRAEASGSVVVAAAGNQGRLAMGQLLSHPVTVPVVAVDKKGRLLSDCNFSPSISHLGVAALGHEVRGYSPGGGTTLMSGASVATAFATGILAKAWSARPYADGAKIRAAVARLDPRDGLVPPMLDDDSLLAALRRTDEAPIIPALIVESGARTNYGKLQGGTTMNDGNGLTRSFGRNAISAAMSTSAVTPAQGAGVCACGRLGGQCTCANGGSSPSRFIYVLGTVHIEFPDQSISNELQDVARTENIVQGTDEPLRHWYYRILSLRTESGTLKARYVARQLCWILTVEGHVAYYLSLRDLDDLPDLVSCLGRPEPEDHHHHYEDLDLFIGSSSLVPSDMCLGIKVPVLAVDQLCSFNKDNLIEWCKTSSKAPPKTSIKRRGAGSNEPNSSAPDPRKLFRMLVQSADNLGDTDEWRALNYLAIRYKYIYEKYAEMADEYELESVKVLPSRLAREKRIMDPVFAFRDKNGVVKKFFVRVDVSHLFPIIVNPLAEYFDR